jgi:hypothetical protein
MGGGGKEVKIFPHIQKKGQKNFSALSIKQGQKIFSGLTSVKQRFKQSNGQIFLI